MLLNHTAAGEVDKPALLFLHGFLGASDDWEGVIPALMTDFRCVAVDLPGHGASADWPEEAFSMEATAGALSVLLDHLDLDRCIPVGYSMGGRMALYFALHHPERCDRLVLESASPGLATEDERAARRGVDEARAVRLETDFDGFLTDWYRQPLFDSIWRDEAGARQMVERRRNNAPEGLARSLRGMGTGRQPSLWERLETLDVSTLALAGALDGKFVEIVERMAILSPKIRSAIVPDTGHAVHAERPEVFVQHIKSFLSTL